jgi:hypothetical protein
MRLGAMMAASIALVATLDVAPRTPGTMPAGYR